MVSTASAFRGMLSVLAAWSIVPVFGRQCHRHLLFLLHHYPHPPHHQITALAITTYADAVIITIVVTMTCDSIKRHCHLSSTDKGCGCGCCGCCRSLGLPNLAGFVIRSMRVGNTGQGF